MELRAHSIPLSSSHCSSSQLQCAVSNILFSEDTFKFFDSWTCHIEPCSLRQRITRCNSVNSQCLQNWSCQQCFYGGSDLQCQICETHCKSEPCFSSDCYAYFCSDSLRAYQCYFAASDCYTQQQQTSLTASNPMYSVTFISNACKDCALNDQNVEACYNCYSACRSHTCWSNCTMSSNFAVNAISSSQQQPYSPHNISQQHTAPMFFTTNAIFGIMAMIALVSLILGFWCGQNCNTHILGKLCCKPCVFWCDDETEESERSFNEYDGDSDQDDSDETTNSDEDSDDVVDDIRADDVTETKSKRSIIEKRSKKRKRKRRMSQSTEDGTISLNNNSHQIQVLPKREYKLRLKQSKKYTNNYRDRAPLNKKKSKNYQSTQKKVSKHLRLRFPMTPLSSMDIGGQHTKEMSPDVRVAHFGTPTVPQQNDGAKQSFHSLHIEPMTNDVANKDNNNNEANNNNTMGQMQSFGSDEEDAPSSNTASKSTQQSLTNNNNGNGNNNLVNSEMVKKKGRKKKRSKSSGNTAKLDAILAERGCDSFDSFVAASQRIIDKRNKGLKSRSKPRKQSKDDSFVSSSEENSLLHSNIKKRSKKSNIKKSKSMRKFHTGNQNQNIIDVHLSDSPMQTRRVTSTDSGLVGRDKQITILQRKRVVSPPPIKSKSEFESLIKPTQSADVVALERRRRNEGNYKINVDVFNKTNDQ